MIKIACLEHQQWHNESNTFQTLALAFLCFRSRWNGNCALTGFLLYWCEIPFVISETHMLDLKAWTLTFLKRSQTDEFDYTSINLLGQKLRKNIWHDLSVNEKEVIKMLSSADSFIYLFFFCLFISTRWCECHHNPNSHDDVINSFRTGTFLLVLE